MTSPRWAAPAAAPLRAAALAALALVWTACSYGTTEPEAEKVNAQLRALRDAEAVVLVDALEGLIAEGADQTEDREFAYWVLAQRGLPDAAPDAWARAAAAGRVAQLKGLNAGDLVKEVEHFARLSRSVDPTFRDGAAQRMLGTLYVLAPAYMLRHGDSETGLELLEELVERYPEDVEHRLALAEAYVALDDPEPAREHLCYARAHADALRGDSRAQLTELMTELRLKDCASE